VQFFLHPYDRWYSMFQEYYAEGLRTYVEGCGGRFERIGMTRWPSVLAPLRRIRYAQPLQRLYARAPWVPRAVDRAAGWLSGELRSPSRAFHPCVGQYLVQDGDGRRHRVCIDSCDYGNLPREELVAWSEVYFKTNFWPSRSYPDRVLPMVNCSPQVLPRLESLRALRTTAKEFDVCFLVRAWGGRDGLEGVEHNLRLAEAVARLGTRTFVHAYLVSGDVEAQARRLERAGVAWSRHPMSMEAYWSIAARSRLCVVRLGMHDCIPWGLTGAFAIGACPVLDRKPLTLWPEPLQPGVHFLDLGIDTPADQRVGDPAAYGAVPGRLERWLQQDGLVQGIAARTAQYFDRALHPTRVGAHVFEVLERRAVV
jgi:hypothetical protein